MTKQRLAEIMKEIAEGSEDLIEKDIVCILAIRERKAEGSNVAILGAREPIGAEEIAISILRDVWEHCCDMSFGDYMRSICEVIIEAEKMGEFRMRGLD